jgi:protein tyrosine/serine phosphatase
MENCARRFVFRSPQTLPLAFLFILTLVATSSAQSGSPEKAEKVKIKNFGQMDDRFYRGAEPDEEDYKNLAGLGIHTIIDLTDKPEDYARHSAEAAGLRYISIPMSDKKRPPDEQIDEFLRIVNDPSTGKFYVHCEGGRHRTGLMGAVYRMNFYGWDFKQAYKEMKQYDFYTRWGHGPIKDYVEDYYQRILTRGIEVSTGDSNK